MQDSASKGTTTYLEAVNMRSVLAEAVMAVVAWVLLLFF
jgi:hypothetical protein